MAAASIFTQEIADEICEQLMLGKTLTKICKQEGMPHYTTIVKWLAKNEKFREEYQFARNVGYEKMSDDILDIADDNSADVDTNGKEIWDTINRARLKVDTRKWLLSHALPKKYGNKTTQEITQTVTKIEKPLTPEEKFDLARHLAFELTKATKQPDLKVVK